MSRITDGPGQLRLSIGTDPAAEFADFVAAILNHHLKRGSTGKTLQDVRKAFRILESLDVRTIEGLSDPDLVPRFLEAMARRKWAESTRDKFQRHLHSIIRDAVELGFLDAQPPLPSLHKPGGRRWREHHPDLERSPLPPRDDIRRLEYFLEARANRWSGFRLFVLFMIEIETGIPLAAALRLTPDDIDLALEHAIRYRPRRGRMSRAPMSPRLETILSYWLRYCGPRWVLPARSRIVPWSEAAVNAELEATCRAIRIPQMTCQQLRWFHDEHGPGGTNPWSEPGSGHLSPQGDERATLARPDAADPKPGINYGALSEALLRGGFERPSQLVKFMEHRTIATFQDVMDEVCGGERADPSIRALVNRTNNALRSLRSPLRFTTRDGQVIRHEDRATPMQQPCNG